MKIIIMLLFAFAGFRVFAASNNYNVVVKGMHCADCSQAVRDALQKLPDVKPGSVTVSLEKNTATITVKDGANVPEQAIRDAVKKAGYVVSSIEPVKK